MKKLFFALSMVLFALAAQAQNPVSWSFDAKKVSGDEYAVTFTADVNTGWYIYSQFLDDDGPIPTNFEFDNKEKFTFVGEISEKGERKSGYDEIFGMELIKFAGEVVFTQVVKAKAGETLSGYLEYMTCNDHQCLPPTEVEFSIELPAN